MKTPKYTFLIPSFKAEFFTEALESVKKQSYKDFICIVSDDCSPDNLKSIFDEIVGDDSRFVFRCNVENMGSKSLVSHWKLLVDMCETEFFIMASDDDVYAPNFLEEINKLTEKYPKVDLFRGRVKCIDASGKTQVNDCLLPEIQNQVQFFRKYYSNDYLTCEANFCYRTSKFRAKNGYIEFPLAWFTDDATHILMAENGCANTTEILFGFRSTGLNISNQWKDSNCAAKKIEATLLFDEWISDYVSQIKEDAEEPCLKTNAIGVCKEKILKNINIGLKHCCWNDFKELASESSKRFGISRVLLYYNWWLAHKH